ncbi:putative nicotinate-nucleotide adenylyltransferase [Thalassotalea insulae]|uniref:Probable nicotinate-nucleotide adenylyltransferase n=1 Tax=Thalassotalea insulae TaxID=2056778 RepID=A0ABQ6GS60_9GAMM|nr:nicotinate-nucleotide adenylyltransferase [Thalassotalea insulae]GLX77521.1 putative nicotinate-nucleotide adenylyltransferase [Thalassotalea insulae]
MNTPNKLSNAQPLQRIGILGGTFDPIHYGHILPAIETAKWLTLDSLHLMPAHIPPHKASTIASPEQRMQMVKIACQHHPLLAMDNRELLRNKPSYTVDTLQELKQEHKNSQLFFVMGMDSLLNFTRWHQWQEILTLCHLVVNIRPGYQSSQHLSTISPSLTQHLVESITELASLEAGKIIIHQQLALDISSTELRAEIANSSFNPDKIPRAVIEYIQQQQLYQQQD